MRMCPKTTGVLALVAAAVTMLGGCAGLFGAHRAPLVGDQPCPRGTQKAGGPPPKGTIEACVGVCAVPPPQGGSSRDAAWWRKQNLRRHCLNGPYRSWAKDGHLRATGEMGALLGPTGLWTFFDPDGSKALTCDFGESPVACTEFKTGAAEATAPVALQNYVGGLTDLMDRKDGMAVDLLDTGGQVRERRLYSPNGTLMVTCPPTHIAAYHQYTQNRRSPDEHDFEAYCIQQPPNPCPRDPCVKYTGLHCEMRDGDSKCVKDDPLVDGTYRYWNRGREIAEEGTYAAGVKVGEWTKFHGKQKEITVYDDRGRRTAMRLVSDAGPLWEAAFDGDSFVSVSRALRDGGRLVVQAAKGEPPFSCEFRGADDTLIAEGPCSSNDPIKGEVVKQGTWKELAGRKRTTVRYIDGVSEQERREAERRASAEAKEREREARQAERERRAALARGECTFDGIDGVECELRLCAKIAAKVKRMRPNTSCFPGEPLDSYRSDWGQALRAIDRYAGVLRRRGDARGFLRIQQRVKACKTPQWFRSCSN